MKDTSTTSTVNHRAPFSPEFPTAHVAIQFEELMTEVSEVIAPVWPLKDYVAVNPYAGLAHRKFIDARAFLRVFSDCELLMPIEYYAVEFHQGRFSISDIEAALGELAAVGISPTANAEQIVAVLSSYGPEADLPNFLVAAPNRDRHIRTIAEYATKASGTPWTAVIVEEISKHCAAHYDQGQAAWSSPYQELSLYQAWRSVAEYDFNPEAMGLSGFRKFVAGLPCTPEAAIVHLLQRLEVPQSLRATYLLCQAFSMPGWSAWTKYQAEWTPACMKENDLTGLIAIRLAYDVALAEAKALSVNWNSLVDNESISFRSPWRAVGDDSLVRYALLRASEIRYRNELLASLAISSEKPPEKSERKLAQMVFCIDVRSERFRRQLESQSGDLETLGFAGFFGMAFEYATLGQASGNRHLPVLLQPQFKLQEGFSDGESPAEFNAIRDRHNGRSWRKVWKAFQTSAVGCFPFVETSGLLYGFKLLGRALGLRSQSTDPKFDGLLKEDHDKIGPTLRGLNQQGITTSRQVDMAEGMLRNLGLTKDFAKLVVFCGHACQTENNPLAASLDCGACGGHSGEPNARFAALLLNQPFVRQALAQRGIEIPADTCFLGALHNTTTDAIEFFDTENLPEGHQAPLQELIRSCELATQQTQAERLPIVASHTLADLLKRASDWSEVRPEWGLAGNAAFIVAPRAVTKHANLNGRSFLHSYDYTQDDGGKVLETIMTAPMIVANWINMQYYASTVDNRHFGSGTKTVHNVVGGFGILSGNGGDLMTGLPWQSLHSGEAYQHQPMRLQVMIAAPREMIDRVIAKHELVANLLSGGWVHLIAMEEREFFRFTENGSWESIQAVQSANVTGV